MLAEGEAHQQAAVSSDMDRKNTAQVAKTTRGCHSFQDLHMRLT